MSTPTTTQQTGSPLPLTTAQVNGAPVLIRRALRHQVTEPGVVTVGVAVRLSLEDVAAVLFGYNASPAELADPDQVRALVADAVLNGGCLQLDIERADTAALQDTAPDCEESAYLALCRDQAAAVFASTSPATQTVLAGGALR